MERTVPRRLRRRARMCHGALAVTLSLFVALIMDTANATTLAFSAASVAGEAGDTLAKAHAGQDDGPPPPKDEDHGSGFKWPYADATAAPGNVSASRRGANDSSCDDDEILPATCGYYARPARGCGRPRTCRDCLELDDCMVNQFGACVNISKNGYEPALDYHKAFEFNLTGSGASGANTTLRYHFPATNATYCAANDTTCLECKRTVFAGDVTDSRFCVGANDCLCIASCEATGWEQLAGGLRCGPPPRPKAFAAGGGPPKFKPEEGENANTSSGVNWRDVWTMGGIPALVVVVGILVVRSHRLETRRRDEATRQQQQEQQDGSGGEGSGNEATTADNASSSNRPGRLNLAGWQASRREQKDKKENLALDSARGEKDVSPKHHFVDLLDTRQSVNPQVTVLAAPVMAAVVVEASAPPMSPQHEDEGMEPPSAPSFDSEFEYDQDAVDHV